MTEKLNILLVDDNPGFREDLKYWLQEKLGQYVEDYADGENALAAFQNDPDKFQLVLADYYLKGDEISTGVALLDRLKVLRKNIPVIIITGGGENEISRQALKAGAYWYLGKPIERVELEVLINAVVRLQRANQQVKQLRKITEEYYHPSLMTLSQALFAESDFNVLVQTINQQAGNFLDAAACQLILVDPDTGKITNREDWVGSNQVFIKHYAKRKLTRELTRNGNFHIVSNVAEAEAALDRELIRSGFQAFAGAACPQINGARAVLYAYFNTPLDNDRETKLKSNLITLAHLVGLAIERIRHDELTNAVVEAGRKLLSTNSLEKIYEVVGQTISEAFQVSTFYLASYNESSKLISFPLLLDKGKKFKSKDRLNTTDEGGLTGYIIREGQELGYSNPEERSKLPVEMKPVGNKILPGVYFGVPLRLSNEQVIGTISIQRYEEQQFLEHSKQSLRTLATLVASAIDRLNNEIAKEKILAGLLNRPLVETLEEIAREVKEATGADVVTVHPYDAIRKSFAKDRIRLGLGEDEARTGYYGSEIEALERLLDLKEHFTDRSRTDPIFKSEFINRNRIISTGGITLQAGEPAYPIGVLVVNFKSNHHFDENDKEVLRNYAQRAVLAVQIARLAQQERMVRARINAEHEATNAIRKMINPYDTELKTAMIKDVIAAITSVWDDPNSKITPSILFSNLKKDKLFFAKEVAETYKIDIDEEKTRDWIRYGEGICGWVAETKQSLLVPDVEKSPLYLKLIRETRSEICVPIKLGNRLLGVLDIESPQINFFEDADRIFLERISDEMGLALGASGIRDGADKVIRAALDAVKDPEHALQILVNSARKIANISDQASNSTTIFLRTPAGLKPVAASPEEILPGVIQKIGPAMALEAPGGQKRGIIVRAFLEAKSQFVPDVDKDADYIRFDDNTKAELDIPIFSGFEVIGVINVEYTNPADLTMDDQLLLESLAAQTSFIATIRRQADDLGQKERERSEARALALMGIASVDQGHRWKTAASTVAGTRDLMAKHFNDGWHGWRKQLAMGLHKSKMGPDPEKVFKWLERMERNINFAMERPQNPSLPHEKLESIHVNAWLGKLIERWEEIEEKVIFEQDFQVADDEEIQANPFWLTRAVENLIANATRAAHTNSAGDEAVVIVRSLRKNGHLQIEVEDNGPGIPEKVLPYLFTDAIPDNVGRLGHGVGCLTTQFTLRMYEGRAFVQRTGKNGTVVTIEIPFKSDGNTREYL